MCNNNHSETRPLKELRLTQEACGCERHQGIVPLGRPVLELFAKMMPSGARSTMADGEELLLTRVPWCAQHKNRLLPSYASS
jgi:hypothetical protein